MQGGLRRQDFFELGDGAAQLIGLGFQFQARKLGQAAQPQLQDVFRLGLGEVENLHQATLGRGGVIRSANHFDNFVQVQHRYQQAVNQVQSLAFARQAVLGAASSNRNAVIDENLQGLAQPQGAHLAVHQGHHVDSEGFLQRGLLVELGQNGFGMETVLYFHHKTHPVLAV